MTNRQKWNNWYNGKLSVENLNLCTFFFIIENIFTNIKHMLSIDRMYVRTLNYLHVDTISM